ncbi:MAG: serine protease [Candidatus Hydrogenedentota bacterium]
MNGVATTIIVVLVWAASWVTAAASEKEIYGTDDRIDVFQETDPTIRAMAMGVCALVSAEYLVDNGDGSYTIVYPEVLPEYLLCEDEPFAGQPVLSFCTGFMVAPQLVATAGHCIIGDDTLDVRIVFGFDMIDAQTAPTIVSADNVYSVDRIVEATNNGFIDYAIVETDRPITAPGAAPLTLRTEGIVPNDARLGVIGHPLGLPKKIGFGAESGIYVNNRLVAWFVADFDGSHGNSGSPIINQETGIVEGIYVRSTVEDYSISRGCLELNQVGNDDAGQQVVRSVEFAGLLTDDEPTPSSCAAATKPRFRSSLMDGLLLIVSGTLAILVRHGKVRVGA